MLTRLRRLHDDERGVSLIELLVVVVLMSAIGGVVTTSLVKGMQVSASTQSRFDALADLQKSVDRMTRELRAAAPLAVGGAPVLVAEPHRVAVYSFRTDDTTATPTAFGERRRFTYRYCPTQQTLLARVEGPTPAPSGAVPGLSCGASTSILISDVANGAYDPAVAGSAVFTYYDSNGTLLPQPVVLASVQRIRVVVTRALPNQDPITVETMVRLRNAR